MANVTITLDLLPAPARVQEDIPRQLMALRNLKMLDWVVQTQSKHGRDLAWLSESITAISRLDAEARDAILMHPSVFLWCEVAKSIAESSEAIIAKWEADGYNDVALTLWLHTGIAPIGGTVSIDLNEQGQTYLCRRFVTVPDATQGETVRAEVEGDSLTLFLAQGPVHLDRAELLQTLQNAPEEKQVIEGSGLVLDSTSPWLHLYAELVDTKALGMDRDFKVTEAAPEVFENVRAGAELVRDYWPEMYEELKAYVRRLVVVERPAPISFSDFRCHGTTLYAHNPHNPLKWAEWIVHESSHLRLNTLMVGRPHLLNTMEEMYVSPWRNELRPLFGIYHGCFVHCRVMDLFKQLQQNSDLYADELKEEIHNKREELVRGLEMIRQHGKLTPDGEALMAVMETYLQ